MKSFLCARELRDGTLPKNWPHSWTNSHILWQVFAVRVDCFSANKFIWEFLSRESPSSLSVLWSCVGTLEKPQSSGHFSAPFTDDVGPGTSTDPQTTFVFLDNLWVFGMVFAQNQKRHVVGYFPGVFCPCEVVKIGTLMNTTPAKLLFPRFYLHLPRVCKWTLPRIWSVALLSSMPGRKPTKQYGQQRLQPLPSGRIPRCEGQQSLQSMPCTCHYCIARIGVSFRLWLPRRIH